jgi:hypothetical protein
MQQTMKSGRWSGVASDQISLIADRQAGALENPARRNAGTPCSVHFLLSTREHHFAWGTIDRAGRLPAHAVEIGRLSHCNFSVPLRVRSCFYELRTVLCFRLSLLNKLKRSSEKQKKQKQNLHGYYKRQTCCYCIHVTQRRLAEKAAA